ncbi:hypothetical protein QEG73_22085 [Chitinophagaceae bacterium 26-R-25]|nr:hypothetical protein [Chitinophagaceae bacterium 26-R-25]
MNKKKFVLLVLAMGIAVASWATWYVFFKPHRNVGAEKAKYEVTSTTLSGEFKTDTAVALKKYINQAVLIQGKVTNVDGITVSLNNIACNIDSTDISKISGIKAGDDIKVQGLLVGYNDLMEEVNIAECVIKK